MHQQIHVSSILLHKALVISLITNLVIERAGMSNKLTGRLRLPVASRLVDQRTLLLELGVVKSARLAAAMLRRGCNTRQAHAATTTRAAEPGARIRQDLVGRIEAGPSDVRRALVVSGRQKEKSLTLPHMYEAEAKASIIHSRMNE